MPTMPTIRRGSKGQSVKYCQERLNTKGFHCDVDGMFGKGTEAVVKQYQASENLGVDGVVGGGTWNRLLVETEAEPPKDVLGEQRQWLLDQIPADTPANVRVVLEVACKALGLKEIPNGSNKGPEIAPYVSGYNEYWKIGDTTGRPWCAMFVASVIAIGMGMEPNPSWGDWKGHPWYDEKTRGKAFRGSSSDVENWAKNAGKWTAAKASTKAPGGAYFTMARGSSGSDAASSPSAGHVGMIVCDNGDGTVYTIEGNVSNKVGCHKRKKTELRGWGTWW